MQKHQYTILSLLFTTPLLAYANSALPDATDFNFHGNWQNSTQDIFQSYQDNYRLNSALLFANMVKDNPLKFETASIERGTLSFGYPEHIDLPQGDDLVEKAQPYTFQGLHVDKFIPKDLMPYLGLRMRYNITSNFSLVNDITTKNIFYGLSYSY